VHQEFQLFLKHPAHLSVLMVPEVHSQGHLGDLCPQECQGHLAHQGCLVLLLPIRIPAGQRKKLMSDEMRHGWMDPYSQTE